MIVSKPAPRGAVCGDHIALEGEACDDGNTSNEDACVNGCKLATCGDGFVRASFEACDDGNRINTDGCRNTCALPTCGDGIPDPAEECDDGDGDNTDECPSLCLFARCGDGFVQAGVEECDGGAANTDKPGYVLTHGDLAQTVTPIGLSKSAAEFYSYTSASAHTGLEDLQTSNLFLYRDLTNGTLSLVTIHGIDVDSTGIDQPASKVKQSFLFLPTETFVSLADDDESEFKKDTPTSAAIGRFITTRTGASSRGSRLPERGRSISRSRTSTGWTPGITSARTPQTSRSKRPPR
jgi:cysteine-rich repeat protein